MEEEKILVRKIRNSFKNGRTRAEIVTALQSQGCNLAYADALISKAKRPKKIIITSIITILILGALAVAALAIITPAPIAQSGETYVIKNPLNGFKVIFEKKPEGIPVPLKIKNNTSHPNAPEQEIYLEDLEITPEFISYLLEEIGATKTLHKNAITRENPLINFDIGTAQYQSELIDSIEVKPGLNPKADIQFNSNKETIVRATLSDNPGQVFKDSIMVDGTTKIEKMAGDTELFAKGYLDLYDKFKE